MVKSGENGGMENSTPVNVNDRIVQKFIVAGKLVMELKNPTTVGVVVKCPFPVTRGMSLDGEKLHYVNSTVGVVVKYLLLEGFIPENMPVQTFFTQ